MNIQSMPLPGLALPEDPPGLVAINKRCSMQTEAGRRLIAVRGILTANYALDDGPAEAMAMVNRIATGAASQVEVSRAFGLSTRQVRRYQRRGEEDGGLKPEGHGEKGFGIHGLMIAESSISTHPGGVARAWKARRIPLRGRGFARPPGPRPSHTLATDWKPLMRFPQRPLASYHQQRSPTQFSEETKILGHRRTRSLSNAGMQRRGLSRSETGRPGPNEGSGPLPSRHL
jgi:hypothetical protein